MRNFILFCIVVVLTTGCAGIGTIKSGIAQHGADLADDTVETAIWQLCNGSSVGSIKRRFKTVEEKDALEVICP